MPLSPMLLPLALAAAAAAAAAAAVAPPPPPALVSHLRYGLGVSASAAVGPSVPLQPLTPSRLRRRSCVRASLSPSDSAAVDPSVPLQPPTPSQPSRLRCGRISADAAVGGCEQLQPVTEWVAASGGVVDGVAVAAADGDGDAVSLAASRDIRRSEPLVSVPEDLRISAETALRSDLGKWIAEFEPALADFSFIALSLLHERRLGEDSVFSEWLGSDLWSRSADLPLMWSEEAQEELCASTSAPFRERLEATAADFAWLEANVFSEDPLFFPPFVFSQQAFTEAVAIAISRAVWIGAKDQELPAVVPMIELVGHSEQPNTEVKNKAAKPGFFGGEGEPAAVQLVALVDIPEGTPLTMRYSDATRAELLVDYGFLQEPVPPEASMTVSFDEEDFNFDDKADIVERAGLAAEQQFVLTEQGEVSPELMAYLRLRHLKGADAFLLEALFRDIVWQEHLMLPVSEANERESIDFALSWCSAMLDKMPGSLQADLAILAEAPRASVGYKLAALRYAERRAVEASVRAFKAKLGELSSLEYYQERRLRSLNLTPIETEEELEALREESARAAGRSVSQDYEW